MDASIIRRCFLDMRVCVPKDWTDEQVIAFAEENNPCGTEKGWLIRREGSIRLGGDPERNQCAECTDNVHIVVEA